jgi:uncharacterized protein
MHQHRRNQRRFTAASPFGSSLLLLIIIIATVHSAPAQAANPLTGHWQGALSVGGTSLRLAFSITEADGKLTGKMRSLDQGGGEIPLSAVKVDKQEVRLEAAVIGAAFEGKLNKAADEITGTWTQGPGKLPLTLKRTAAAATLNRPQEPKPPFPYREEQVSIRTGVTGVTLAGTLTLPAGAGPHSAVVLLTGSGPQDRDEAIMGHRPFLVLADHLARQGIAVAMIVASPNQLGASARRRMSTLWKTRLRRCLG